MELREFNPTNVNFESIKDFDIVENIKEGLSKNFEDIGVTLENYVLEDIATRLAHKNVFGVSTIEKLDVNEEIKRMALTDNCFSFGSENEDEDEENDEYDNYDQDEEMNISSIHVNAYIVDDNIIMLYHEFMGEEKVTVIGFKEFLDSVSDTTILSNTLANTIRQNKMQNYKVKCEAL